MEAQLMMKWSSRKQMEWVVARCEWSVVVIPLITKLSLRSDLILKPRLKRLRLPRSNTLCVSLSVSEH